MRDQELGGDQFEVTDSPSRFAEVEVDGSDL
jgi:hypothetical protein